MRAGRLANVGAAVLLGDVQRRDRNERVRSGPAAAGAIRWLRVLDSIVCETALVGRVPDGLREGHRVIDPPGTACALAGLVAAFEASTCERLVVLAGDLSQPSVDLLLALSAWPDADAVVPRHGGQDRPLCAIYRREPVASVAREQLSRGRLAFGALLDRVETVRVSLVDLGLADLDDGPFARGATSEDRAPLEVA